MKHKTFHPKIKPLGLCLFVPEDDALIVSDIHLGFEEYLHSQGILIPRTNFSKAMQGMQEVFARHNSFGKIIINGDLKHEFGSISEQEWREVLGFLDFISKHCKEIILIKGNHDNILGPIARFKNLAVKQDYFLPKARILVMHGNELPSGKEFRQAKAIIIGHEHPSISLKEGAKKENYKAFLKGKFHSKELIVMPSFFFLSEGSDLLKEETLSPFLEKNLGSFEAWLYEKGKLFYFGRLKNLQQLH